MNTDTNDQPKTDAETCVRAGIVIGTKSLVDVQGVPTLIVPPNYYVKQFADLLPAPVRTEQTVACETAKSFIDYFNHFANDNSAVFCDTNAEKFTGVIDYHSAGRAAWCKHSVIYKCQRTHEASAWLANNSKKMEQEEFAVFIEDNALEIVTPPGATMLEIATHLKAQKKVNFISGTVLSNGQQSIRYMEEIQGSAGAKGELQIPEMIELGMRIFEGGEAYKLQARFRYRINTGKLIMWYDIIRPKQTLRAAVDDAYTVIKAAAKTQLFLNASAG